ncbi:MAG TPA: cation:proton antiporter [Pirellulales bacterium]|nr:cation:proton antiporter [Pirellulales bacterium]
MKYTAMLVVAVGLFLAIDHFGGLLAAPAAAGGAGHATAGSLDTVVHWIPRQAGKPDLQAGKPDLQAGKPDPRLADHSALFHVLLTMAAMIVSGRLLSRLFRRFGQPPVIGEVVAGILLGPSLLGLVAPDVSAFLLPPAVAPYLAVVAQLGVIFYMFLVGLELNSELLRRRARAAVAISHAGIVVPLVLGAGLALALYPRLAPDGVPFTSFALFLGVAMAITAFPVLARILTDRRMTRSELGVMALTCAAVDDVTAWCLLALVVGVAQSHLGGAVVVIAGTVLYIALMFLVARPAVARWVCRDDAIGLTPGMTAAVFAAVLLSSLATEWIGIHAIFGAFLLGAVIPHDSRVARELTDKLEAPVTILLLPAFFAYTGMRTQIGLVSGCESWLTCGLIIVVATLGKFGGTFAAARVSGLGWRDAAALGTLMNTRGLMELVVLNIGLDLGVISPLLFAMMVLMALATTMATSPVLSWLVDP